MWLLFGCYLFIVQLITVILSTNTVQKWIMFLYCELWIFLTQLITWNTIHSWSIRFDHFWSLLIIFYRFWSLLVSMDHFWSLLIPLIPTIIFWSLLITFARYWSLWFLLLFFDPYWPLSITFGHYWYLLISILFAFNHYTDPFWTLLITMDHYDRHYGSFIYQNKLRLSQQLHLDENQNEEKNHKI